MSRPLLAALAIVACAHMQSAPSPQEVPVKATAGADAKQVLGAEFDQLKWAGFPTLMRNETGGYESRMAYALMDGNGGLKLAIGGAAVRTDYSIEADRATQRRINELLRKVEVLSKLVGVAKELAKLPGAPASLAANIEEVEQQLAASTAPLKK